MKKLLLLLAVVFGAVSMSNAQIVVSGNITSNTTWTSNNTYILNGFVFVKPGTTLTIQPGTLIKGDSVSKGSLIIEPGAKIYANGTAEQPIVFTSQKAAGSRSYGNWGGLIVCGLASVNQPANGALGTTQGQAVVEGGVATIYGGGTTPNDDDSSGVIRYVRVEFGGIPFQPNSEINGITFCGVGRKTLVENIMVSYSGDDAVECFGGTVNIKNLICYRNWDDDLDTDFGYKGMIQNVLVIRDPNIADQSGSNGFESDNDATGTTNTPITQPIYSNVTIVGPLAFSASPNSLYRRALHLRRNTRTSVYNSVLIGYPTGLLIESTSTQTNATNGDLQFRNNVLCMMSDTLAASTSGTAATNNVNGAFNISTWFATAGFNNQTIGTASALGYTNLSLTAPNMLLTAGSPLLSGADFSNPNLSNSFFTPTTHIGAFGASNDWTKCWAEWDPQNQAYNAEIDNSVTATITPSGATTFCSGNSVELSANTVAGGSYEWSNSQATADITVTTSGTYSVTVTNSKGCEATSSPVTVTVNALPSVSITAGGATSFCTGGSVVLTSSQSGSGNVWSTAATTNNITVNSTGTYTVTYTDGNGCSSTSNAINVNVSSSPLPSITAGGNTSICQGQSVTLSCGTSDSYQWNLNGSPISGATNQTYNATASGNYTVTVTNADACDGVGTSIATAVFVNPTPTAAATASTTPGSLTVNFTNSSLGATSYNWNFGDGNNSTAVNPSHTYASNGNYIVTLIATSGSCSDTVTINLSALSVENEVEAIASALLFPNPANNTVTLNVDLTVEGDLNIEIYDLTGKMIMNQNHNNLYNGSYSFNLNTADLTNGIYLVNINTANGSKMMKLIINH